MRRIVAALIPCVVCLAPVAFAAPPDGFPDPTFGTGGSVTLAFQRPSGTALGELGVGLARTSDGKILVAGQCTGPGAFAVCVARLDEDGVVDATFGAAGDGLARQTHPTFAVTDMALHPDGTITLCGYANGAPVLSRLTSNGTFLTPSPTGFSFGADLAAPDAIRCAASPGGHLYVGGVVIQPTSANDLAVVRLDATGALDPAFSGDGRAILSRTPAQADQEVFGDLTATPDGGVVLVGNVFPQATPIDSASTGWEICALTATGQARPGFGASGCKPFQVSASSLEYQAFAVTMDSAQRIVVAGTMTTFDVIYDYAVGRFLLDGSRDPGFNGGEVLSIASTSADGDLAPRGIGVDALGKPVVAGLRDVAGQHQLLVLRVLADGSGLDHGFGTDGAGLIAAGSSSHRFGGLVLDRDRPVVLGSTLAGDTALDFFVARLQSYPLFADGFED